MSCPVNAAEHAGFAGGRASLTSVGLVDNLVDAFGASQPAGSSGIPGNVENFAAALLNILANAVAIKTAGNQAEANRGGCDQQKYKEQCRVAQSSAP